MSALYIFGFYKNNNEGFPLAEIYLNPRSGYHLAVTHLRDSKISHSAKQNISHRASDISFTRRRRLHISLVTTKFTPVPRMFSSTCVPVLTGEASSTPSSRAIASNILSLGIAPSVFTGQRAYSAPVILTVDVTTRVGASSSRLPYSAPRGQRFPLTA